jgi:hypothetical protein
MKAPKLSRRAVLRGAGGIAVALPFLDIMRATPSSAGPIGAPKRFITFFTPNGMIAEDFDNSVVFDNWTPTGTETNFTLSPILQPLQPYKDKIIVVDGVHMQVSDPLADADGHKPGMGIQLTGAPSNANNTSSGTSLDFTIGKVASATTKFSSYRTSVFQGEYCGMFYSAPGQYAPPENSPKKVFSDMFSDLAQPTDELAKLRAQRKSVLDAVQSDLKALSSRLGRDDQQVLDSHTTAIRGLEQQIATGATIGGSCAVPTGIDTTLDPDAMANTPALGKAMMDMIAMAIACDLTRVAAIQWGDMASQQVFSWLGQTNGHHDLSHSDNDLASYTSLTAINNWYAKQFAYLVGKLAAIPEGNGTALDNTIILWTNDLRSGGTHSRRGIPYVLAGSCGGYFRTGRFVQYPKYGSAGSHVVNDLLVSIANAMGLNINTYGKPEWCTGALPNLT